ncbi:MAG: glycosyltransferase family 4 protein [Flavobacteriales bacterium]|nr:glycosyltransferase family 4 protein [Flavobacteriales bacterium]
MPKILFVAAHRPGRSPSQRYRFEQFLPYWKKHGWTAELTWLIDEADDAVFYSKGQLAGKARIFLKAWRKRWEHVRKAAEADVIFVQREAFMTGSTRFERALKASGRPFIFDLDDAIWRLDVSEGNRHLRWLKDPGKTGRIAALADLVIAGNPHLGEQAGAWNRNVEVIPTVVDTERYQVIRSRAEGPVVIGWTGSQTSMTHLLPALPMLRRIQQRFGERVAFRIIADRPFSDPGLNVEGIVWRESTEPEDLNAIDIGIMPLPDDEWSRGKCGFKGLQYMALGKAVVLSSVGVNTQIVKHGQNGLLACTDAEWEEALGRLVEDADLRAKLGNEARRTVEEEYSVRRWRDRYLELFNDLTTSHGYHRRTEKDALPEQA